MSDKPPQLKITEYLALADYLLVEKDFQRAETYYRLAHNAATSIANDCMEQMRYAASQNRNSGSK